MHRLPEPNREGEIARAGGSSPISADVLSGIETGPEGAAQNARNAEIPGSSACTMTSAFTGDGVAIEAQYGRLQALAVFTPATVEREPVATEKRT